MDLKQDIRSESDTREEYELKVSRRRRRGALAP